MKIFDFRRQQVRAVEREGASEVVSVDPSPLHPLSEQYPSDTSPKPREATVTGPSSATRTAHVRDRPDRRSYNRRRGRIAFLRSTEMQWQRRDSNSSVGYETSYHVPPRA
jgi:hypothetical protein